MRSLPAGVLGFTDGHARWNNLQMEPDALAMACAFYEGVVYVRNPAVRHSLLELGYMTEGPPIRKWNTRIGFPLSLTKKGYKRVLEIVNQGEHGKAQRKVNKMMLHRALSKQKHWRYPW